MSPHLMAGFNRSQHHWSDALPELGLGCGYTVCVDSSGHADHHTSYQDAEEGVLVPVCYACILH